MRKSKLILFVVLFALILPIVNAQIESSIEFVGTTIFNFFLNDYVVFFVMIIFLYILLYGVFRAGLNRIPSIAQGGHTGKIGAGLAMLAVTGFMYYFIAQGIKETLANILTPIGFFGGVALAFLVFGFFWYTMQDGEGNKNWAMAFIAGGLAFLFWGQLTESPNAMSWGWVLLIIGLFGAFASSFGGGGEGGAGTGGRGGGPHRDTGEQRRWRPGPRHPPPPPTPPPPPGEEDEEGDEDEDEDDDDPRDRTIQGILLDFEATEFKSDETFKAQPGDILCDPSNFPNVMPIVNGDPAKLRVVYGRLSNKYLTIDPANIDINTDDGTFEIRNLPRMKGLIVEYQDDGETYRHKKAPWGRGGSGSLNNPSDRIKKINLKDSDEPNVVVPCTKGIIQGRLIDGVRSDMSWERAGGIRKTGKQIEEAPDPPVVVISTTVNPDDINAYQGTTEINIPSKLKNYEAATGNFEIFGLPLNTAVRVGYEGDMNGPYQQYVGGLYSTYFALLGRGLTYHTDAPWGRGGKGLGTTENEAPPEPITLTLRNFYDDYVIIGHGRRLINGRTVSAQPSGPWDSPVEGVLVEAVHPTSGELKDAAARTDVHGNFMIDITDWGWDPIAGIVVRWKDRPADNNTAGNGGNPTSLDLEDKQGWLKYPANHAEELRVPISGVVAYVHPDDDTHDIDESSTNPKNYEVDFWVGRTSGPAVVQCQLDIEWSGMTNGDDPLLNDIFDQHCNHGKKGHIGLDVGGFQTVMDIEPGKITQYTGELKMGTGG
ncbi:MAG: hypothetical protein QGH47_02720, partial [Candidatus Woesearchaeota archaeon]|nr:hypothetical protein [Candidatus Woesearchaeota archaeon]